MWEEIIYQHECFEKLIVNENSKNKEYLKVLTAKYKIKRVVMLVYHSQMNNIIKRKHTAIIKASSKMLKKDLNHWTRNLHAVLWINWTIVKSSIKQTWAKLIYKSEMILLIKLNIFIWQIFEWKKCKLVSFNDVTMIWRK